MFKWHHNWEAFRDLERQMDRLLEGFRLPIPGLRLEKPFPPVNVYELENEYLLTAELPGTVAENLELTVSGNAVTLKGDRTLPDGVLDERFRRHERFCGTWERSFTLPERVLEDKVVAEFNAGILKVHLPKSEQRQTRQIPVLNHPLPGN